MSNVLSQIALWCTSCKFHEKSGGEEPCATCLKIGEIVDGAKPVHYDGPKPVFYKKRRYEQ